MMVSIDRFQSPHRDAGPARLAVVLIGVLAVGVLVAAPSSAGASREPKNLGTKVASLPTGKAVKTGAFPAARRVITTTTTLTSSQNPSKRGRPVTFTATVTATAAGILPTGPVVFRDGIKSLGLAQLNDHAQASFTTSSLDKGTHNITALYLSTASFDTSTSRVLIQRVKGSGANNNNNNNSDSR